MTDDEAADAERARIEHDVLDEELRDHLCQDCCESACTVCRTFRSLSHLLLDQGCTVAFMIEKENPGAYFEPPGTIHIRRVDIDVNAAGTMAELAYLAHEAGHWKSLHSGARDPAFGPLKDKLAEPNARASAADQLLLIEEEELAWKLGRAMLEDLAPELHDSFWTNFTKERQRCVATYYSGTPWEVVPDAPQPR